MDMKLSEILFKSAEPLWLEAADKPFVVSMAKGTLDNERFRTYMMQDYLYLLDYIKILTKTFELAEDPALKAFLRDLIDATKSETMSVHVPNMRKLGISDEDISSCEKEDVISEYVGFMRQQLEEKGLIAGLTALLQCSWVYAYIANIETERFSDAIAASPYRSWFEAYISEEYTKSNRKWIDVLDKEAEAADHDKTKELCRIFQKCAEFENCLWDAF